MVLVYFILVQSSRENIIPYFRDANIPLGSKVVIIYPANGHSGREFKEAFTPIIRNAFGSAFGSIEFMWVDNYNIMNAALQLVLLANARKGNDNEIIFYLTETSKGLTMAAYIAACITASKIVTVVIKPESLPEPRTRKFVEVPRLPLRSPKNNYQYGVLWAIRSGTASETQLLMVIRGDSVRADQQRFIREKVRLHRALRTFERLGLITRTKIGRTVQIQLTPLGTIYSDLGRNYVVYDSERGLILSE